jgi:GT2 family glycosyltransferase
VKASFIIVNWNTRDLTAQAVESILRFEAAADAEIIVVDNHSSDGSAAYLMDRFPGVRILANKENLGFAKANNQGAQAASGEWIVLFNSDAYLTSPVFDAMQRAAEGIGGGNANPVILTCKLKYPDGADQLCAMSFPSLAGYLREVNSDTATATLRMLAEPESRPGGIAAVDWVTGAFLMVPRQAYLDLGGLDPSIFMYAEDMDFCRKAAERGIRSFQVKTVSAVHIGGGSIDYQSARALLLTDAGRLAYFRRWHGLLGASALRGIFIYRSLTRAALFTAMGIFRGDATRLSRARVHARGLAGLLGLR